ncbi:acyl-CoA/acyl-ACP dehydrogenase [Brevibacterium sp. 50QC2O2]|jgi:alkylation response protein AidB-like acyl-CoA dehydrogenase|uniref:acyl-CoA dehydrogenase family protein n=1 Tax=Brevibacterium sp. 50QC2O2 TaxID=2968459 RepID=UPI00211CE64A|nr:acyl-CoA dehydrogenase family protein [Brevibacterium sp. 50QC2O2]MCQ9387272.1 acyl-CoA/acyl-ACP dehydrogenase [Brevibacterium sp. 50QC2O2]
MTDREARHAELAETYLPDELLETLRSRAADYDAQNTFFFADLDDLRAQGYLTLFVPEEFGGPGLSLNQVARLQTRLATAAPGTALAINMHLMCTGVAHALRARGDHSLDWVLQDAAAGEVFAFGISEPSNDWVLQGANTRAVPITEGPDEGGYALSGVKIFTSLSPAWTRLIVHATDDSNPDDPRLVYGFLDRPGALGGKLSGTADSLPGVTTSDDWDVLGMRASQSRATILDGAVMRPDRIARTMEPGQAAAKDLLVFGITVNFQLLIASVYAGVARRGLELGAAALRRRKSAKGGTTLAEVGEWRVRLADAAMAQMPVNAQIDAYTRDFDELTDHGAGWPQRLLTARINAGTQARRATETALILGGGASFNASGEAARLYRDAAAGIFHPAPEDSARALFAAAWLDD